MGIFAFAPLLLFVAPIVWVILLGIVVRKIRLLSEFRHVIFWGLGVLPSILVYISLAITGYNVIASEDLKSWIVHASLALVVAMGIGSFFFLLPLLVFHSVLRHR